MSARRDNRTFGELEALLENLPGLLYRCALDADWTMQYLSASCLDLTGYAPEDLIGNARLSFADLIHPDDRQMVEDLILDQLDSGPGYELSYRIVTAGGESKWVWERGKAIHGDDGCIAALEGFITDITASKQMQGLLAESEQRFQALFAHSPVPLWEEDFTGLYEYFDELRAQGVRDFEKYFLEHPDEVGVCANKVEVLNVNGAALRMLGAATEEELLGALDKLYTESSLEVFGGELVALAQGALEYQTEGDMVTLGGESRQLYLTLSIHHRDNGTVIGMLATLDITERKKMEAQLRQALKMESVGRLAGGVAHDYNNTLSVIIGYTELALGNLDPEHEACADLRQVLGAADKAAAITRQLLAYARRQTIAPEVLDLNDSV